MIYGLIRNDKLVGFTLNKKSIPSCYKYVVYNSLKEYNSHRYSLRRHK